MLSHELRNPLAPIRNAVEVIRRVGAAPTRSSPWRATWSTARSAHLARLVDELLDVSRISQGKITLKKEPVELGQVIAHSVETARPLIEARGQTLAVRLPPAPVWLSGDFARLRRWSPTCSTTPPSTRREGGRIELSRERARGRGDDRGARQRRRHRARSCCRSVFDLFVQGERSLDRSQGGLGIGLTLVKRLVELHQGRVEATSDGPGKGAEFTRHRCPASARSSRSAPNRPRRRRHAGPQVYGRRVLVVDDNVDAAESTAAFLRLEGHEVKAVHDGLQALASLKVFDPHVVVLDIGLPGLDGYEVARQLRARGDTSHVLLIALTGYGQKEDRQRAAEAGFDYHFVKPADPREIQVAIERGRNTAGEPALEAHRFGALPKASIRARSAPARSRARAPAARGTRRSGRTRETPPSTPMNTVSAPIVGAAGHQPRAQEVVDRHHEAAPQRHEQRRAPAVLRREHDHRRHPDHRRAGQRNQRGERGEHAEHHRRGQADDGEADADQRALHQRGDAGAVDQRARHRGEMPEQPRACPRSATGTSSRAVSSQRARRRGWRRTG